MIKDYLLSQNGNTGDIYWNWCTDNLWPNQGYYVNGTLTPWCAEFVSCMLLWTGSTAPYFPDSCAFDYREIPIEQRYYAQSIRPLDIISFDWDDDNTGDHVGIVLDVYDWGCHTIEGNSCEVVCERDRYWDSILFGIRPDWGEEMTEEDKRDIARMCAEYIYEPCKEDVDNNLNMYNAAHWAYYLAREIRDTLKDVNDKLDRMGK